MEFLLGESRESNEILRECMGLLPKKNSLKCQRSWVPQKLKYFLHNPYNCPTLAVASDKSGSTTALLSSSFHVLLHSTDNCQLLKSISLTTFSGFLMEQNSKKCRLTKQSSNLPSKKVASHLSVLTKIPFFPSSIDKSKSTVRSFPPDIEKHSLEFIDGGFLMVSCSQEMSIWNLKDLGPDDDDRPPVCQTRLVNMVNQILKTTLGFSVEHSSQLEIRTAEADMKLFAILMSGNQILEEDRDFLILNIIPKPKEEPMVQIKRELPTKDSKSKKTSKKSSSSHSSTTFKKPSYPSSLQIVNMKILKTELTTIFPNEMTIYVAGNLSSVASNFVSPPYVWKISFGDLKKEFITEAYYNIQQLIPNHVIKEDFNIQIKEWQYPLLGSFPLSPISLSQSSTITHIAVALPSSRIIAIPVSTFDEKAPGGDFLSFPPLCVPGGAAAELPTLPILGLVASHGRPGYIIITTPCHAILCCLGSHGEYEIVWMYKSHDNKEVIFDSFFLEDVLNSFVGLVLAESGKFLTGTVYLSLFAQIENDKTTNLSAFTRCPRPVVKIDMSRIAGIVSSTPIIGSSNFIAITGLSGAVASFTNSFDNSTSWAKLLPEFQSLETNNIHRENLEEFDDLLTVDLKDEKTKAEISREWKSVISTLVDSLNDCRPSKTENEFVNRTLLPDANSKFPIHSLSWGFKYSISNPLHSEEEESPKKVKMPLMQNLNFNIETSKEEKFKLMQQILSRN
eukprot:GHVP01028670.1.p1 GENE.GHVP01028670.1~~GHVP01028670.1.p1  ORF type:complete len:746 (+),score=129.67 GHVP01028670.1:39-2240(+)